MTEIWAHTLVKNEERFVWYAVTSVIDYVDKVLLWDTGSTDNTLKILKKLKEKYPEKIDLRLLDSVTVEQFTEIRQEMLNKTDSDWFLVCDADEIWWKDSIKKITDTINDQGGNIESIFTPAVLALGDMFHYQDKQAGKYRLAGKVGHFGLKAVKRSIPGLSSLKPHGSWGWVDENNKMIQNRDPKKLLFVDAPFLHTSYLQRSKSAAFDKKVPKRGKKYKVEIGEKFPLDFYYPESFFQSRPDLVDSVWQAISLGYKAKATILTPFKKVRRRMFK